MLGGRAGLSADWSFHMAPPGTIVGAVEVLDMPSGVVTFGKLASGFAPAASTRLALPARSSAPSMVRVSIFITSSFRYHAGRAFCASGDGDEVGFDCEEKVARR